MVRSLVVRGLVVSSPVVAEALKAKLDREREEEIVKLPATAAA